MPYRDLILLSGGLDSTTALAQAVHSSSAAHALSIDYQQRHRVEIDHAHDLARWYAVPWSLATVDVPAYGSVSALTGPTVAPIAPRDQAVTVVPGRNLLMVATAAATADALGCDRVVIACHAGDHDVYPDCRPAWVDAVDAVLWLQTEGRVQLHAPFAHLPRVEVATLAGRLGVPIDRTWSCYRGGSIQCGQCGACASRRAALAAAGVSDGMGA